MTWAAVLPPQVEEAGHAFLLMKKDYRISRNVRLAWVLSRLHQVIWAVPEPELVSRCQGWMVSPRPGVASWCCATQEQLDPAEDCTPVTFSDSSFGLA